MWSDYYEYADGRLYHKVSRPGCRKGDRVGTPKSDGYRLIGHKGKKYREHRVIYEMHYGPIPEGLDIDHINRDRADNRIENLRAVTRSQNIQNSSWKGTHKKGNKWRAYIQLGDKKTYLGTYDTEEQAHQSYKEAKLLHHGVTV